MREFAGGPPVASRKRNWSDLLGFLYFLNYFDEPGEPQVGKVLFAQKHCIQCHSLGREGGTAGPRLDVLPRGTAPLGSPRTSGTTALSWSPRSVGPELDVPRFEGSEIIDLFAYLRSRGERQTTREFRSSGDPEQGKRLFAVKGCARCHGVFSERPRSSDRTSAEAGIAGSVTQLAGRKWNHWPEIRKPWERWGWLPHVPAGTSWPTSLRIFSCPATTAAAARQARRRCVQAQGVRRVPRPGGEGNVGPSLRKVTVGENKEAIFQRMWNHAPKMRDKMGLQVPWPRFEADELAALLAFWPMVGKTAAGPRRGRLTMTRDTRNVHA